MTASVRLGGNVSHHPCPGCEGSQLRGFIGEDGEGRPIPCPVCKPYINGGPASSNHTDSTSGPIHALAEGVSLSPMSAVSDDAARWAWTHGGAGRIALGTLCLFTGRPGVGKSSAARWIASCASTGRLPGELAGVPCNVALVGVGREESAAVIKASLRACGADLGRVHQVRVGAAGAERSVSALRHFDDLAYGFLAQDVRLVIVDPIVSTMGGGTDMNRSNEVRAQLEPWVQLAERIDGVVIGVTHLRKSGHTDLVASINGSSAFGEVARSVFAFAKNPHSTTDRVMTQIKNSLGPEDLSLVYRLTPVTFSAGGRVGSTARFDLGGTSAVTATDALADTIDDDDRSGDKDGVPAIDDWLLRLLAKGDRTSNDVYAATHAVGYSVDQAKRAKKRINENKAGRYRKRIEVYQPTKPGPWFWKLAKATEQEGPKCG